MASQCSLLTITSKTKGKGRRSACLQVSRLFLLLELIHVLARSLIDIPKDSHEVVLVGSRKLASRAHEFH